MFTFIGLLTNICLIFFTDNRLRNVPLSHKLSSILVVENFVLIFLMFIGYRSLPLWFEYREKIEVGYLKKFSQTITSNHKDRKLQKLKTCKSPLHKKTKSSHKSNKSIKNIKK